MALKRNGMERLWRSNRVLSLHQLCCHAIVGTTSGYGIDKLPLPDAVKETRLLGLTIPSEGLQKPRNAGNPFYDIFIKFWSNDLNCLQMYMICLQIWPILSANMTNNVCKYDQNCLKMSHLAGILVSSILEFLQACPSVDNGVLSCLAEIPECWNREFQQDALFANNFGHICTQFYYICRKLNHITNVVVKYRIFLKSLVPTFRGLCQEGMLLSTFH